MVRGEGGEGRRAVDRAEIVAGAGGTEAEDRITTASGAGVEGAAEVIEGRRRDSSEVGGHTEIAVAQENSFFVEGFHGAKKPTAPLGEAGTEGERDLGALTTAVFGEALAHVDLGAFEFALEHVVDDAGNGIRAVNSRGAVAQDFDALDPLRGQLVDVHGLGKAGGHRVDGHTAAVDENERGGRAEVTQIDVGVVAAGAGGAEARFILRQIDHRRQRGEHVDRQKRIAHAHRVLIEDGNRNHFFQVRALDVRASDDEILE